MMNAPAPTPTRHSVSLVGQHYRPPAKAILQVLPSGCPLRVVPEPDNPYDANALAVHVATSDIPALAHGELAEIAGPFGFPLDDILAESEWHLGYVKATEAVWLQPKLTRAIMDRNGYAEQIDPRQIGQIEPHWPALLSFDSAGKPLVVVEV